MSFLSGLASFGRTVFNSAVNRLAGSLYVGDPTVPVDYCIHIQCQDRGIDIVCPMPENMSMSTDSEYDTPFANGLVNLATGMANLPGKIPVIGGAMPQFNQDQVSLGMRMMGASTSTQAMTMQVWQGSSPIEFSIPLHFVLNSDSEADVMGPVRSLMKLTLPSSSNSSSLNNLVGTFTGSGGSSPDAFLVSPGPKLRLKEGSQPSDILNRVAEGAMNPVDSATKMMDAVSNLSPDKLMDGLMGTSLFGLVDIYDNISLRIGNWMLFERVVIKNVSADYQIRLDAYTRKPIELTVTVTFCTFVTPTAEDMDRILT